MIYIIAAVGKNNELGYKNKLIWSISEDMKYFRKVTLGKRVVMGRNTYESIGKPLLNRENIVISSKKIDGVYTTSNIDDVFNFEGDTFIIGGESIYRYFIDDADMIYLTEIDDSRKADAYFPNFDKTKYDKEIVSSGMDKDLKYDFAVYKKKVLRK